MEQVNIFALDLTEKNVVSFDRNLFRKPESIRILDGILEFIHQHYKQKITQQTIARAVCASPHTCTLLFRKALGLTPMEYLKRYRLYVASRKLIQTNLSITIISQECGMDNSHFCQVFRKSTGVTPLEYRRLYQRNRLSLCDKQFPKGISNTVLR